MTMRTSPPQLSFSSGEISPLLWRRQDYQRFQTGLRRCNGYVPLRQGGFTRAPGTLYLGTTHENRPARLIRFQFSAEDALVIELTEFAMRVWRDGALVMDGGAPYVLTTPYDLDAIQRLNWVQSADVIYMADGVLPIQRLARFALDNWSIGPQLFETGPFLVQNLDEDLKITASAATGSVTLTCAEPLFEAGHVGALFRIEPEDFADIPLWQQDTDVSAGDLMRNDGNTYQVSASINTGFVPPIHDRGQARVRHGNSAVWTYLDDGVGVVRITAVTSGTQATAQVIRRMPKPVVDDGSYRWAEGAWSDRQGYPAALEIHDQRLVAAATPTEPRTVWLSAIGDFTDFAPGVEADDAFAYAIAGDGTQNRILWLKSGARGLHIGALGEEYSARSETRAQVIGATTARFGMDSQIGSSAVRPIAPDGNPIFVSRDGRRAFEIRYSFEHDANRVLELSLPSEHLGVPGFREVVWQSAPWRTAWLRRGDGTLTLMVHDPDEDVLGWTPLSLAGGLCRSIAVLPDPDTGLDRNLMVVEREIDGFTVRMIEQQAQPLSDEGGENDIYLFSAVVLEPAPASNELSVPHLAGREVLVWADGQEFEVTAGEAGEIELPVEVDRAVVGLFDATHAAETLDVPASAADGNTIGRQKRLHAAGGIAVHNTGQGWFRTIARSLGKPDQVGGRKAIIPLPVGAPITERFSGVTRMELVTGQAYEAGIEFTPFGNAPMTVLAVIPRVQEAG